MLVHGLGYPLGIRITTNSLMVGINEDDFIELVGRILSNPIGVQDTKRTKATTSTLLKINYYEIRRTDECEKLYLIVDFLYSVLLSTPN